MAQPILQHFGQVIHHDDPKPPSLIAGPGSCTLMTIGPGLPHHLLPDAVTAIRGATMLLVDDLVSESVVALATPGARVIRVGTRHGCLTSPQAFVEKLILMAVREGEQVVHLQAKDPLTEGRRSEEISRLQASGISVSSFSRQASVAQALMALKMTQNLHKLAQSSCF